MRISTLLATTVGVLALAGGANAAQYILTQDNCTSHCIVSPATNDGKITVTSIAGGLHFNIALAANILFNQAGQGHDAFALSFTGNPTVTFQNFSDADLGGTVESPTNDFGLTNRAHPTPTLDTPPFTENGTGSFNAFHYGFDWIGAPANNGSLYPSAGIKQLSFDVLGSGLTSGNNGATPPIYFTVDVARLNADHKVAATGLVGATLVPGVVPEPASWALMILGFGGVGALIRRRRATAAFA